MITKEMKISVMLDLYPQTLDVLLDVSPHFSKLKNKILRKALAGRVNVMQAAGIAGVDLNNLLLKLNSVTGNTAAPAENSSPAGEGGLEVLDTPLKKDKLVELDVRPILNRGEDPLKQIMSAAKKLNDNETLLLINSFEPVPLYSVLEKKGFSHTTVLTGQVYHIYINQSNTEVKSAQPAIAAKRNIDGFVEIDVRGLTPPEPMMKILEAVNQNPGAEFLIHHHREPQLLYGRLTELGYKTAAEQINEDYYKILITRLEDESA